MAHPKQSLTRRRALKVGASVAGALVALRSESLGVLAQAQGASMPATALTSANDTDKDWAKRIEAALGGTKGMFEDNGVFMVDLPRTDIMGAKIFDVPVKPDFALEGVLTFKRVGDNTAMKFEVVLLDKEVNLVLSAWFKQDIKPELEVFTALHNHYLGDSPQIRFMHGFALGNETKIAHALYKALKENSGTPFGHGAEPPGDPGFDWKKVTNILGGTPALANGVLTVSVSRKEDFRQRGVKLPSEMEFESEFSFQSIGGGKVATIDEFVVLKDEADLVARELRRRDILVTALHNHELDVDPDVYYIHAWATGDPLKLTRDLRAALNHTNSEFQ